MDISTAYNTPLLMEETTNNQPANIEIMNKDIREILKPIIVFSILPFNLLGVITNAINIRVFYQQGIVGDSSNIAFTFLALFDLLCSATVIPYVVCTIISHTPNTAMYMTCMTYAVMPIYIHTAMQQTAVWISVYISAVRSACVVWPMKFKIIFTPKFTTAVLLAIPLLHISLQVVYFDITHIEWQYFPGINVTMLRVMDTPASRQYNKYKGIVFNQMFIAIAIIITFASMFIMVYKLNRMKQWRLRNTNTIDKQQKEASQTSTSAKQLSSKDVDLTKFVFAISTIFAVCVSVSAVPTAAIVILPGMSLTEVNHNLYLILYLLRLLFNSINASINFFVYLAISSRYKQTFRESFRIC